MERRIITTTRSCSARLVPTGDPITIPEATFVTLTQSLGGTYTVIFNGNMARVDGKDADALGFECEQLDFPPPSDERVSTEQVHTALASVFDPEIPVDIYELGLIYEVNISDDGIVDIDMTLTSPNCPVAESLPKDVEDKVAAMEGVKSAKVDIVFDPPWTQDMMSEEAKLECGFL